MKYSDMDMDVFQILIVTIFLLLIN